MASANPAASAKAEPLTATLAGADGTPTGTVAFFDGGTPITTCGGSTTSPK